MEVPVPDRRLQWIRSSNQKGSQAAKPLHCRQRTWFNLTISTPECNQGWGSLTHSVSRHSQATFTWTGLFHFHSEWMLIQNRNAHVNTSVWLYQSDLNEFHSGLEGWYIPIESVYIAHVNALVYMSPFACNCVCYLWQKPKILLDSLWLWLIEKTTEIYYYRCLQIKHISNPLCSRLPLSRARTLTHAHACANFSRAMRIPRSNQPTVELPQIKNNAHLTHLTNEELEL